MFQSTSTLVWELFVTSNPLNKNILLWESLFRILRNRAKNNGWRLDYYMVSPEILVRVTSIDVRSKQMGSDHAPLVLQLAGADDKNQKRKKK